MTQQVKRPLNQIDHSFDARLEAWLRARLPVALVDLLTMKNRRPSAGFRANLPAYLVIIVAVIALLIAVF